MHGSPLGEEDLANLKKQFGFDPTLKFHVPDEVSLLLLPHLSPVHRLTTDLTGAQLLRPIRG